MGKRYRSSISAQFSEQYRKSPVLFPFAVVMSDHSAPRHYYIANMQQSNSTVWHVLGLPALVL